MRTVAMTHRKTFLLQCLYLSRNIYFMPKQEEVQVMFKLPAALNKRMRKLAIDMDMSIKEFLAEAIKAMLNGEEVPRGKSK